VIDLLSTYAVCPKLFMEVHAVEQRYKGGSSCMARIGATLLIVFFIIGFIYAWTGAFPTP
jgi:hypothetical protein